MNDKEYILVTGGAGYIGSHTVIELLQNGYNVIIIDNLCNSSYDAVARIEFIARKRVKFIELDLRDTIELSRVFGKYKMKGVIHFAALKAVGESTKIPLEYYANNVGGTISLLEVMKKHDVKTFVFSSSATVYGDATRFENMIPIPENCPNDPTNPYGKTKYQIETILRDIYSADLTWRTAILRYFNPIGAHPSGLIGEDPLGIPNNLLPFIAQVAIGRRDKLYVFGNDYDSHDGTPIRDYIHVVDLAKGHIAALNHLNSLPEDEGLLREWNLGTGKGSTVFDVYNAFCDAIGRKLPFEIVERRAGDVLNLTANPKRANEELKWKALLSINDACADLWRWTSKNPSGFLINNYSWKLFNSTSVDFQSRLHTISLDSFKISIANYGATIQDISYHGKRLINGFDSIVPYLSKENPYFGATIGRYANRISDGSFEIDGKTYDLDKNEENTTLHGGSEGLDKQFFYGPNVQVNDGTYVLEFVFVDKDGHNGFPADVEILVRYKVAQGSLEIEYESKILDTSFEDATAISLTNHTYWNLTDRATIDGTIIQSIANAVLETNSNKLPTGNLILPPHNLKDSFELTKNIKFDECFIMRTSGSGTDTRAENLKKIISMRSDDSNIKVEIYSTEPAFQLYTGDFTDVGEFKARSGLCIEAGRFTDAINNNDWKSQVLLRKGEKYGARLTFKFTDT